VNEHVRQVIDDSPEVPDLEVARARFTLEGSYELDPSDPRIVLAAMAGAGLVGYMADRLLDARAITPREHACLSKVAQSAEFVWAQAVRFAEAQQASVGPA
jgi:hypothetical protein